MSKKTYAIMGATGHIGLVLAEKLLEKGHSVRALGRNDGKLGALKARGAEVLKPAFDDAQALTAAFRGVDGIFTLIPPAYDQEDFSAYQDRAGEAIVRALSAAGARAVVNLSSVGAEVPAGTGPIAGLHRQEQRLKQFSNLRLVHLRPTAFMENQIWSIPVIKAAGVNGSTAPGDVPMHMVATRDIGAKAAEFLDSLSFEGSSVFDFTGPREYTLTEATSALGKAVGKPGLAYVQFSYEDVQKGLLGSGMKPKTVDLMLEMYRAGGEGKLHPTQDLDAAHRGPTTLEVFAPVFAAAFQGA
jgi:uncharacterized protein YbjT (DUF2867 family)